MNPPRVVHIGKFYWPYQRGIETHMKILCEQLIESVDLHVLVANTSCHTQFEDINGVPVTRLARWASIASTQMCPGLVSRLKRLKPDITHIHLPNPWAELCYFLAGCPGKLVVSFHSDIIRQKMLLQLHKPLHTRFLKKADKIIVATPNHITYSPFLSHLPPEKCTVIPYGIHTTDFAKTPEIQKKTAEIQHEYGTPLILFAGQLVYYKGVDILISAMQKCNAHLLIIGDGPLRNQLSKHADACGVKDTVHFTGRVDFPTLCAAYHAADIFCLPSTQRSEAFGIVQLEAFATSTPVVSTALDSGVPWVNQNEKTGLIVPPHNPDALANACNTLLSEPELRKEYGTQAYQRVRTVFSVEQMVEKTVKVYQELCM